MKKDDITIIICCAGMGTRLGIGTTKALVDVCGKPIIIRQLEALDSYSDIRIVVGYQAEKVISVAKKYRNDLMFVFNYDFEHNGPAASLSKALVGSKKYVFVMDGDCIANTLDLNQLLTSKKECIGITEKNGDEAIFVNVEGTRAVSFSGSTGDFEWNGMALVESSKLNKKEGYVFEMLEPLLPLEVVKIRSREVDTQDDYDRMIDWFSKGCKD